MRENVDKICISRFLATYIFFQSRKPFCIIAKPEEMAEEE